MIRPPTFPFVAALVAASLLLSVLAAGCGSEDGDRRGSGTPDARAAGDEADADSGTRLPVTEVSGIVERAEACSVPGRNPGVLVERVRAAAEDLSGFAGMWVDRGCVRLGLVEGTPVPGELRELVPERVKVFRTRWPLAMLTRSMHRIAADISWFRQRGLQLHETDADEEHNRVRVVVSAPDHASLEGVEEAIRQRHGEHVQVERVVRVESPVPVRWDDIEVGDDERTLTISYTHSGEGCGKADHVELDEQRERVVVTLLVTSTNVGACPLVAIPDEIAARLEEPLDGRELVDGLEPVRERATGRRNAVLERGTTVAERERIIAELRAVPWLERARWVGSVGTIVESGRRYPGYVAIDFTRSRPGGSQYDFIRLRIDGVEAYHTRAELRSRGAGPEWPLPVGWLDAEAVDRPGAMDEPVPRIGLASPATFRALDSG